MLAPSSASALVTARGRIGGIQLLSELLDISEIEMGVKVWHNTERTGNPTSGKSVSLSAGPITPIVNSLTEEDGLGM